MTYTAQRPGKQKYYEPKRRRHHERGVSGPIDSRSRCAIFGGTGVWRASWRSMASTVANSWAECCCVSWCENCCSCSDWREVSFDWRFIMDSSGFFEQHGESFAGAMQLAADRIGGLFSQRSDLFIAQLFISDE